MKRTPRRLSILLILVLILSSMSLGVFAEGETDADQPLTAEQAEQYTVVFDLNGHGLVDADTESEIEDQIVEDGALIAEPEEVPAEEGWDFGGWFTDEECTEENKWDFEKEVTADDFTDGEFKLYAKWTKAVPEEEEEPVMLGALADEEPLGENEVTYTVKFELNGHGAERSDQTVPEGGLVKKESPGSNGWKFGGWYTNPSFSGAAWNFSTDQVTADVVTDGVLTLYAKWTAATISNVKVSSSTLSTAAYSGDFKVTWDSDAPSGTSYTVYMYEKSQSGTLKQKKTVTSKYANFYGYKAAGKSYYFKISANSTVYKWSNKITTKTFPKPAAVTNIVAHPGSQSITVDWTKSSGCDGYTVYMATSKSGTYKYIGTASYKDVKNSKVYFKKTGLKTYSTYYFKVKAYKGYSEETSNPSSFSAVASAQPVRPMQYAIKMRTTRTLTSTDGKAKYKVKAGETLKATRFAKGKYLFYDNNAKGYYVNVSWTSSQSCIYTKAWDYDKTTAENFVNERNIGSPTGILIWVSTYTQHAYYFKGTKGNWKLVKHWEVATGKARTPTPTGLYGNKAIWKKIRKQDGLNYWSCFSSDNGFHGKASSWRVGSPASSGCIRCANANAKYVYSNAPIKTQVFIF